ncbi:MAG: hypothetical protein JHC31_07040, partial [Sulfurihydrogenibium sp.]|nr:hypothetical protein [Sulfurihydrogenibium sp.]
MVNFLVDREDLENALENALKDIEFYNNTDVSKVVLKLYAIYDRINTPCKRYETALISTTFITFDKDNGLDENYNKYNILVYKANLDGQELCDYIETSTFESTIYLDKETIEKILEFLSDKTEERVEIIHSKYTKVSCIKC